MPDVAVLMSVFNGERFIDAQIESILAQRDVNVHLLIRDDGSTDGTAGKLIEWQKRSLGRITVTSGPNLGAPHSFMTVAHECRVAAPYYAFSDADDVWLPNKLRSSIDALQFIEVGRPAAYVSAMTLVDEDLSYKGRTAFLPPLVFENALVQARLPGAGTTLNRALFDLLRSYRPRNIVMHDAWVYLLVTAFGAIIYDDTPCLLYRQHGRNISISAASALARFRRRLSAIRTKGDLSRLQAAEFLEEFGGKLTDRKRDVAARFASHNISFLSRMKFVFDPPVTFNTKRSKLLYMARVALGRT